MLTCPKCSDGIRLSKVRLNLEEGERYRRYICKNKNCDYHYFTVEFQVEDNAAFREKFRAASATRGSANE